MEAANYGIATTGPTFYPNFSLSGFVGAETRAVSTLFGANAVPLAVGGAAKVSPANGTLAVRRRRYPSPCGRRIRVAVLTALLAQLGGSVCFL